MEAHIAGVVGFDDEEYANALEAELPEGDGPTENALRVDYLLQKISEEVVAAEGVAEFTARRIEMVKNHGEREINKCRGRIRFLESRVRMLLPSTSKGMQSAFGKKSLGLPHGTVGYRSSPESLAILDPQKALQWAKDNGLQITVKETVAKTPLHEFIKQTGEEPSPDECGFKLEPSVERFYFSTNGGQP